MTHDPGKAPIPQTVEALQEVMARDAETMLDMRREIGDLRSKLNRANHSYHQKPTIEAHNGRR